MSEKVEPLTAETEAYLRRHATPDSRWGSTTIRGLLASLDAERARAAQIAEERDHAERRVRALLDQIEAEGCTVAHFGERTYECGLNKPCGLCRLRDERDALRTELKARREHVQALQDQRERLLFAIDHHTTHGYCEQCCVLLDELEEEKRG